MSRIRGRLSFANVMSAVALFVALGGSAYAVGQGTIGTKQLKNGAVTSPKVANNSLGDQDIGPELLSSDSVGVDVSCPTPEIPINSEPRETNCQVFSDNGDLDINLECTFYLSTDNFWWPRDGGEISVEGASSATINGEQTTAMQVGLDKPVSIFATWAGGFGGSLTATLQLPGSGEDLCSVKGLIVTGT